MKRVFICSPLSGDIKNNQEKAKTYCKYASNNFCAPFAPHIFCTQWLDDTDYDQRCLGMNIGLAYLEACDELWVFKEIGKDLSMGMMKEIEFAAKVTRT